jgi:3-isopropylmalate dehydrogenase
MFEPIHGSAPDIAGKNLANPIGMMASVAMMLTYACHLPQEAQMIETAIQKTLEQGYRTKDIEGPGTKLLGTREMGDQIVKQLKALVA